jgi:hypothetical protein
MLLVSIGTPASGAGLVNLETGCHDARWTNHNLKGCSGLSISFPPAKSSVSPSVQDRRMQT